MPLPTDDDALYTALLARNPAYEGFAFVGVRSTGIFCRLTCPARKPTRTNVVFFDSPAAAAGAGFRPCLRCRPLERHPAQGQLLDTLRRQVSAEPARRWTGAALAASGLDPSTVRRAFKREYGVTFAQYARAQRLGAAVAGLQQGMSVVDAQIEAGYESGSGFREAISRLIGDAPARARGRDLLVAQWLETPIGAMLGIAGDEGLHLLEFVDRTALPGEIARLEKRVGPARFGTHAVLDRVGAQLTRYFSGGSAAFDVPMVTRGTPFEEAVWKGLLEIPAGETRSYSQLALGIGRPGAVRAVGRANGANQIALVIPCHRVIGADGSLVGYGGKPWRKAWLLEHERRFFSTKAG